MLNWNYKIISSVQFSHSVIFDSLPPHGTAACQASLSITNFRNPLKLVSIMLVMPSNHLILRHSLHLPPLILPSTRVPPNESVFHIGWPKHWRPSFSISPSNENSGLTSPSFRYLKTSFVKKKKKKRYNKNRFNVTSEISPMGRSYKTENYSSILERSIK